jgi:exopolyphosphatase/guanosine-5'-triphosphate,3'-diphosphate pyrophosphatase
MPDRRTLAAVDLGSNSFHMLVARLEHGEVRIIDRIREMVRLAAGLDEHGSLDEQVHQNALDCLARFGDRLHNVPRDNIRAVGTQTFRRLEHPGAFLRDAEKALGGPIEIIGGREEARLIYTGVHSTLPHTEDQRLVIDIGGGSTELIIGQQEIPQLTESLQYGCVTVTQRFFPDQKLSKSIWKRAKRALLSDLQGLVENYHQLGWQEAVGTSGTLRAVSSICRKAGWLDHGIDRAALNRLIDRLIDHGRTDNLKMPGLSDRRAPVFAGGVLILDALCEALNIEQLKIAQSALREGLLYDLLGRFSHTDPRNTTIQAMATRYGVDKPQAQRVRDTALQLFDQAADDWALKPAQRELLAWTTDVHEIGLSISHSRYQRHSGYLLRHSDMAGFSRLEQRFMAFLAEHHRRSIGADWHDDMPRRLHNVAAQVLMLLRLSVLLHRSRSSQALPEFRLCIKQHTLEFTVPAQWLQQRPLIAQDLHDEQAAVRPLGIELKILQDENA